MHPCQTRYPITAANWTRSPLTRLTTARWQFHRRNSTNLSDTYAFNLSAQPDDFYRDAKRSLQGQASALENISTSAGLSANGSLNLAGSSSMPATNPSETDQSANPTTKPSPAMTR